MTLYRQTFPQDAKIIDPVSQMKARLAQPRDNDGAGFLAMLQQVASHWAQNGATELQNITYRAENRLLTLNLTAGSLDAVIRLTQRLNGGGLNAKTLSLINDKDGVRGQLSIRMSGQ